MVNFAMQVALKQQSLKELEEQLNLEKRWSTKLAPAEGLYLARIEY
jgi:tRNA U38,U39,U40 pseudouridine synthase TruA